MKIELLYLYIGENNTPVKNVDICFSHDYSIRYENKFLKIEKRKKYEFKEFYGEFIQSCSLIVGKNGSGKTTLLNFLGLLSDNLNKYYNLKGNNNKGKMLNAKEKRNCYEFGCWFALYLIDEEFYIEGYNFERLFGYKYLDEAVIKKDFSLFISYDFKLNKMIPQKLANHCLTTEVDFFYYKRLPETVLSEFKNQNKDYYHHEDKPGQDYTIRLNRRQINSANINNIYTLFNEYNDLLFKDNFSKNAKIIIEINEYDYDDFDQFNRIIKTKVCIDRTKSVESLKNSFISNLYYSLAFGLWNAYFKKYNSNKQGLAKRLNILPINSYEFDREIALYYQEGIKKEYNVYLPNYIEILDTFVDLLNEIDEKYFINNMCIEFPLIKHDSAIQNALDYYYSLDEEESLEHILTMKYTGLSNGEHEYIEVFGSLIKILNEIDLDTECMNRVIILDEPDRTFHPDWISNYIFNITQILNNFGKKTGISFQIIITTHSPFMISDVLKEDIYKIENNNGTRRIINSEYGFASNYYDIMKDTFFLNSSVGKFAEEKIKNINKSINEATNINSIMIIKKYIDAVGDEYLKNILYIAYNKKIKEIAQNDKKYFLREEILKKEEELRILKDLYKKDD